MAAALSPWRSAESAAISARSTSSRAGGSAPELALLGAAAACGRADALGATFGTVGAVSARAELPSSALTPAPQPAPKAEDDEDEGTRRKPARKQDDDDDDTKTRRKR